MTLSTRQRQHLADKLMDTANVILASLVIAGFLERSAQWPLIFSGLCLYFGLVIVTTLLGKGGGN